MCEGRWGSRAGQIGKERCGLEKFAIRKYVEERVR